jgi:hypothetical protein
MHVGKAGVVARVGRRVLEKRRMVDEALRFTSVGGSSSSLLSRVPVDKDLGLPRREEGPQESHGVVLLLSAVACVVAVGAGGVMQDAPLQHLGKLQQQLQVLAAARSAAARSAAARSCSTTLIASSRGRLGCQVRPWP